MKLKNLFIALLALIYGVSNATAEMIVRDSKTTIRKAEPVKVEATDAVEEDLASTSTEVENHDEDHEDDHDEDHDLVGCDKDDHDDEEEHDLIGCDKDDHEDEHDLISNDHDEDHDDEDHDEDHHLISNDHDDDHDDEDHDEDHGHYSA